MLNPAWAPHCIVLLKKFEKKIVWHLSKTFVAQFDDFVACNVVNVGVVLE
jgi:hypothetical protein